MVSYRYQKGNNMGLLAHTGCRKERYAIVVSLKCRMKTTYVVGERTESSAFRVAPSCAVPMKRQLLGNSNAEDCHGRLCGREAVI